MGIIGKPKFEGLIRDMTVGQIGYTLPWALIFDENETSYLKLNYPISPSPCGTSRMPIKRISPAKDGYEIDLNPLDSRTREHTWDITPRKEIFLNLNNAFEDIVVISSGTKINGKNSLEKNILLYN